MTKIQAKLYGMQTQQGVLFFVIYSHLKINWGQCKLSSKIDCRGLTGFGSGDMPFSIRRGSYRSIILETVQLLQKDKFTKKERGKSRIGL